MNLVLAILAQTKFGKSTLLALLSKIFFRLLKIFSLASGRTKTLTEYYYDRDNENTDIWIMDIVLRTRECLGGTQNDVSSYNENLAKNPVLSTALGLEPLSEGGKPNEYLAQKMEELCFRPIADVDIKRLLCTEKLDDFVKKIVIRVPANDILKAYLDKRDITFSARDTKGLMDFAMDDKLEKSNANLSEIGLDSVDGALFGCSDNYPNWVQDVYKDTLYNVFNSVPTFLLAKDNSLYRSFGKGREISEASVNEFITEYQNGDNPDYEEMDDELFRDTNQLFTELGIMQKDSGTYSFSETYFGKKETEFLLPLSTTLKKYGTHDVELEDLEEAADFRFLMMVATVSVIKMSETILNFKESVKKLKTDGYAREFMIRAAESTKDLLMDDLARYNNASHGSNAALYCKPQLNNVTYQMLQSNIDDPNVDIMGPNGGITTRNNGKLRYYTTAVVAVSARKWLDHIISNVVITEDIRDAGGEIMFPGLESNYEAQTKLVKNILRNCLYEDYTDTEATIQYHLCVKRDKASFGIEERRKAPVLDPAFKQTVEVIVNDFCRALAESEADVRSC